MCRNRLIRLRFRLLAWLALARLTVFRRFHEWAVRIVRGHVDHIVPLLLRLSLCLRGRLVVLTTAIVRRISVILLIVALLLALLVLLLLRLPLSLFALRFGQHPQIMFRVLLEVLRRHTVIRQLRVAGQLIILINDLLWRTAHLALRP